MTGIQSSDNMTGTMSEKAVFCKCFERTVWAPVFSFIFVALNMGVELCLRLCDKVTLGARVTNFLAVNVSQVLHDGLTTTVHERAELAFVPDNSSSCRFS